MSISVKEIAWVAGLLEGEGSFGLTNKGKSPAIFLSMTDIDIVERFRILTDKLKIISTCQDNRQEHYKTVYRVTLNGHIAVGWMMTIYSMMSIRRKARIRECLQAWRIHQIDSRYSNSLEAKSKKSLTIHLRAMNFTEPAIGIARGLKTAGFSDEQVLLKLEELGLTSNQIM